MEGDDILGKVRASAKYVKETAEQIHIDSDALHAFVDSLNIDEFATVSTVKKMPLTFTSVTDETNFWCLLALLNFGSGYRVPLHDLCRRGAYDTMLRGVFSMQVSGETLDTAYLKSVSLMTIGNLFDIPLYEDKSIQEGVFYISSPGPLHSLGVKIQETLNHTGNILEEQGCQGGLGEWVMKFVKNEGGTPRTAAQLVEKLAATFPAFKDKATYHGQGVFILKKAQVFAADLYRRLRDKEPAFAFADIERLTVFSDNVLPAVLAKLGILKYSSSLESHIKHREETKPGSEQEIELRCMAIQACEEILVALNENQEKKAQWKEKRQEEGFNSSALDLYLWKKGKEKGFRETERHYTRDTIYY